MYLSFFVYFNPSINWGFSTNYHYFLFVCISRYMYVRYFFAVVSCKLFRDLLAGLNNTEIVHSRLITKPAMFSHTPTKTQLITRF